MNKIFPIITAIILSISFVYGTEFSDTDEVILDTSEEFIQDVTIEESVLNDKKTLSEKLKDVYNLEIDKYDRPSYLFEEILKHKYPKESKLDYTKFWGAYNAYNDIDINSETSHHTYGFNAVNLGFDGAFKDNNADFRVMLSFPPKSHRNFFQTLFSDVYVATNKIPNHRFILGYTRAPVGKEGGNSAYTLPLLNRAQISRKFGTARKIGARVQGDYDFIDYDLGLYSSGTYFQSFFPGAEFAGWVNIKPLAKTKGKYGTLKIGGGLEGGHWNSDYCVTGAYVGYEYKKFMANFEWANANGYNGLAGHVIDKHASGFYTTIGYMLTKKLQLILRYDEFDPDKKIKNNNKREYTAGLNYFIKGQALRIILNYVFCQNDGGNNSHRILLGTQILL